MKKLTVEQKLRKIIREEYRKILRTESISNSDHLLICWDSSSGRIGKPLAFLVAKSKSDVIVYDGRKGELADLLQRELKRPIDPDDFDTEYITVLDFKEEYMNAKNPNPINLLKYPHINI